MAGDWIKMRGNLWDDPRITRLCDLTETGEAAVVGGLYWLWTTADQHTEDGIMPGLSIRQIDRKTGIPGFGDALISIGWVADHPEGIRICNFEDHNGASAKKRCQTAKRVATFKYGNAEVTQQALPEQQVSVTGALPREEKRREEKKEEIPEPTVLVVAAENPASNDLLGNVVSMPKRIPCPYEKIVDVFHEACPSLPRIAMLSDKRKKHLAARWSGVDEKAKFISVEDGLQIFRDVFAKAHTSNFLSGRSGAWKASFDWLIASETNFLKVVEGNYDNDQRA